MMEYKKPKCDCGEELVWYQEKVCGQYYKIKNTGERYVRSIPRKKYPGGTLYEGLECLRCNNDYEIDTTKINGKSVIIRGEKRL